MFFIIYSYDISDTSDVLNDTSDVLNDTSDVLDMC